MRISKTTNARGYPNPAAAMAERANAADQQPSDSEVWLNLLVMKSYLILTCQSH